MTSSTDFRDIGKRVAAAREELGRSQAELAIELAIDRTAVAKIESGKRKMSANELVRLAAVLDRPIGWFVDESPPSVVSRRSDPAVGHHSRVLDRAIDRIARDVAFLEREAVLPPISFKHLKVPTNVHEAEHAAKQARRMMGAASGPLNDLQRHCESVGLLAFSLNLGAEGRDAAYVSVDSWGVAVINGTVDAGRRRFNLAHELGHHLFADAYAPEVTISNSGSTEPLINGFAVHLLLPRADVTTVWEEQSDQRQAAVAIAVRFRASWTAVLNHLRNLELLDETARQTLIAAPPTRADFLQLGEHLTAELEAPSVPPSYGRRVLSAYRTGRLTPARTVELMRGTIEEAELPPLDDVPLAARTKDFALLT